MTIAVRRERHSSRLLFQRTEIVDFLCAPWQGLVRQRCLRSCISMHQSKADECRLVVQETGCNYGQKLLSVRVLETIRVNHIIALKSRALTAMTHSLESFSQEKTRPRREGKHEENFNSKRPEVTACFLSQDAHTNQICRFKTTH